MNRATSPTGWAKNPDGTPGYTFNPITGCLNHVDGLCKGGNFPCYAWGLANGRLKPLYLANLNIATQDETTGNPFRDPFYPRFWPEKVSEMKPLFHRKEKGIFVCDMSDLFGIGIPDDWISQVLFAIKVNPWHRFYLLTKQPQNLIKFSPFPDNCWVGVTATNTDMFYNACFQLRNIKATVKYLSLEPLLDFAQPGYVLDMEHWIKNWLWHGIKWVIIGAQTKPYKPPKIEWVREIVEACDKAGIPVFLKDNLKPLLTSNFKGKDVIESHNLWAFKYFKLRQEMPKGE